MEYLKHLDDLSRFAFGVLNVKNPTYLKLDRNEVFIPMDSTLECDLVTLCPIGKETVVIELQHFVLELDPGVTYFLKPVTVPIDERKLEARGFKLTSNLTESDLEDNRFWTLDEISYRKIQHDVRTRNLTESELEDNRLNLDEISYLNIQNVLVKVDDLNDTFPGYLTFQSTGDEVWQTFGHTIDLIISKNDKSLVFVYSTMENKRRLEKANIKHQCFILGGKLPINVDPKENLLAFLKERFIDLLKMEIGSQKLEMSCWPFENVSSIEFLEKCLIPHLHVVRADQNKNRVDQYKFYKYYKFGYKFKWCFMNVYFRETKFPATNRKLFCNCTNMQSFPKTWSIVWGPGLIDFIIFNPKEATNGGFEIVLQGSGNCKLIHARET